MDIILPEAAEASIRLLGEAGKTVQVLDNCCCGLPAYAYGDLEAAKRLAIKNIELLAAGEFDTIVTDCSSCAAFLKKYSELFDESDVWHDKAKTVASRVRDLVELTFLEDAPPLEEEDRIILTYHDPCHASRGQGLVHEPRELLRAIPGAEYREMPEADWCCGGAGAYALSHYDLSMKVLHRKMDNVEKTGANILVTSCPACVVQLDYGIRLRQLPVRVCHISELLSKAKGAISWAL
ncbi:MAG: (Fe-S)-binding protein [Deltaproteobacteria bacterium]|nr:(Fe-S)-binding protein [Deltaproteobacteria bacterium]